MQLKPAKRAKDFKRSFFYSLNQDSCWVTFFLYQLFFPLHVSFNHKLAFLKEANGFRRSRLQVTYHIMKKENSVSVFTASYLKFKYIEANLNHFLCLSQCHTNTIFLGLEYRNKSMVARSIALSQMV